jgi:hypothetical protein
MRLRTTSSAIATGSMAASSRADCAPWASGTSLPHQPRLGRNGFAERLIGSIRRECVDHIIVLGEILEQGCASHSAGSANRCDQFTRHPGQTSSPLRPRLSCRYTQPFVALGRPLSLGPIGSGKAINRLMFTWIGLTERRAAPIATSAGGGLACSGDNMVDTL